MLRSFRHRVDHAQYYDPVPDPWDTRPNGANHGTNQIRVIVGDYDTAAMSRLLKAPQVAAKTGVGRKRGIRRRASAGRPGVVRQSRYY